MIHFVDVLTDIRNFPGGCLIAKGLDDLEQGRETAEALLVAIGAPRLQRLGFKVPDLSSPEHRLYLVLVCSDPDGAHSRFNALVRRLTSFERAAECAG